MGWRRVGIFIVFVSVFYIIGRLTINSVLSAFSVTLQDLGNLVITSNEQEIGLVASVSGLPSESFFRIAFQKESGRPYFGYMKNNAGEWVKIDTSQDCKNYLKVSDTSVSAVFLVSKIGEDNSIENGDYTFKLRRYTSSCASYLDSNSVGVVINLPTPVPTPTPTQSPTQAPTPVQSASLTVTPTPTPTPSATPKKTPMVTTKPSGTVTPVSSPTLTPLVLSESDEDGTDEKDTNGEVKGRGGINLLAGILVFLGTVCVGVSGYLAYKKAKYGNRENNI